MVSCMGDGSGEGSTLHSARAGCSLGASETGRFAEGMIPIPVSTVADFVGPEDKRADNLFLRLFSYSPRLKGRFPLEDFCTEALAWCLRNSSSFRTDFLRLLDIDGKHLDAGKIETQDSFDEDDETGSGGSKETEAGRLDLKIQIGEREELIFIESKAWADFGHEQLAKYRRELDRQLDKLEFKRSRLVSLTNSRRRPEGVDAHIMWSSVQPLLERQNCGGDSDVAATMCVQFGEFLKEKGFGPVNVPTMTPKSLKECLEGMRLRENLEAVLKSLKNDEKLGPIIARKRITYEDSGDGPIWLGIYGNLPNFWIGFGFRERQGSMELFMMVEQSFSGNRYDEFKKGRRPRVNPKYEAGRTWLDVEQTVDRDFNGKGEEMKEWFLNTGMWMTQIK